MTGSLRKMANDDDEKYSKINKSRAKVRKLLLLLGLLMVALTAVFVYTHQNSPVVVSVSSAFESTEDIERHYQGIDELVRAKKKTGVMMEVDPDSLRLTAQLQDAARKLIQRRYGVHDHYRVKVDLEFPPVMPDYQEKGFTGQIVIEMAPIEHIPVSVLTFLEVARSWKRGAFHRNAGHVLQASTNAADVHDHMPFQEYSEHFPHEKGTTGYCGRPSGPCWYVSIMDNTKNHGPGSQQKENPYEADSNFGRVIEGMDDVVPRIHSVPAKGWLDKSNEIDIVRMQVLVPDFSGEFVPWNGDARRVLK